MKTLTLPILVLVMLTSLSSCDKSSFDGLSCETFTLNVPFTAELGDFKCMLTTQPNTTWGISLGPMLEDSRCNFAHVDCVWAGRFVMEATIHNGESIIKDTFDARALSEEIWSDTLFHDGFEIILAKVHPAFAWVEPIDTADYAFDMIIRN